MLSFPVTLDNSVFSAATLSILSEFKASVGFAVENFGVEKEQRILLVSWTAQLFYPIDKFFFIEYKLGQNLICKNVIHFYANKIWT